MESGRTNEDSMRVQLRRYPNRRYYDAARSQHRTLEDIFRVICDGQEVQIIDSKTGEDITVRVLAQLILEQAPGKLAALPAKLLHQIIRSNESLLREFIDKYFCRAFAAFIESQREFDGYLRRSLGLSGTAEPSGTAELSTATEEGRGTLPGQSLPFFSPSWATMMMGPFAPALLAGGAGPLSAGPAAGPGEKQEKQSDAMRPDAMKAIEELKQEVEVLREELKKR